MFATSQNSSSFSPIHILSGKCCSLAWNHLSAGRRADGVYPGLFHADCHMGNICSHLVSGLHSPNWKLYHCKATVAHSQELPSPVTLRTPTTPDGVHPKAISGSTQPSHAAPFALTQLERLQLLVLAQHIANIFPSVFLRSCCRATSSENRSAVLYPPAKYLTPPSNPFFLPQSSTCEHSIPKIKINCHDVQFLDIWGFLLSGETGT